MKRSLKDLRQWKSYLRNVAQAVVSEDRVMDAGWHFIQCQEWSIKQSDGFCLTDGGSYELLISLMKNTKNSRQAKQIEYLWDEFFPEMHPSWHGLYRPLTNELMAMRGRCEGVK